MTAISLKWIARPRVLGIAVAKLILSVASPLAGQPEVALALRTPVVQECSVLQLEAGNAPAPALWQGREC